MIDGHEFSNDHGVLKIQHVVPFRLFSSLSRPLAHGYRVRIIEKVHTAHTIIHEHSLYFKFKSLERRQHVYKPPGKVI